METNEFINIATNRILGGNGKVVWFSKVLQNQKGLFFNPETKNYYEITYNGDKKEFYVDEYVKSDNYVVREV